MHGILRGERALRVTLNMPHFHSSDHIVLLNVSRDPAIAERKTLPLSATRLLKRLAPFGTWRSTQIS